MTATPRRAGVPPSREITGPLVDGVRRVAVLRANGIGDLVVTLPALGALRSAYPGARITVIGDSWLPPLLQARSGPWDEAVVAPPYPGLRGLPSDGEPGEESERFLAYHRERRYDLAVQLHGGGANSNPFVAGLGARVTAGARAAGAAALDRDVPYLAGRHETLRCLDVVRLVGADVAGTADLQPVLTVTGPDVAESRRLVPDEAPFVAVHAGARDLRRRWPPASFAAVTRQLLSQDVRVVLVGGPGDRTVSQEVRAAAGSRVADATGALSLGGLLGLLSRAALFVGNDSGPRHLAVAAGTATLGIFWVGNLLVFGPLVGARHRTVTSYRSGCPVCGVEQARGRCAHDVSFVDDISVAEVLTEVRALLEA